MTSPGFGDSAAASSANGPATGDPSGGPTSLLTDQLQRFLRDQLSTDHFQVTGLRAIGVGRSRDNWVFDLATNDARESLVLRCDPAGGLVQTDRSREFAVLRALEADPLPSPDALWLDPDGRWFGRPALVMRRSPGTCDYRVVNGERPLAERRQLAERFCDLLAEVHAVDWRGRGLGAVLDDPGERPSLHELDRWERILRQDQLEAWPELDFAIASLRSRAPRAEHVVLVHADFKPGNILLDNLDVTALLDWELAHLGDPLEDLGWVTQPLRTVEHLIDGAWEQADLLERYSRHTGRSIDPDGLAWWSDFSTFKTAVMQISGLRSFLDGRSDEPYRPTRRVLSTLVDHLAERS